LNRQIYFFMGRRARRVLLTALIVWTAVGGIVTDVLAEEPARTWHTDHARLLDSPELINSTVRLPGTGELYDSQKVSDELVQMLFAELKAERGIHGETVLATLGALAGFSVQMALRETLIRAGKMPEDKVFVVIKTKNGESFYLGDLTNEGLFKAKPGNYSVFAIVGGVPKRPARRNCPTSRILLSTLPARSVRTSSASLVYPPNICRMAARSTC
jgi:hypothetical protein